LVLAKSLSHRWFSAISSKPNRNASVNAFDDLRPSICRIKRPRSHTSHPDRLVVFCGPTVGRQQPKLFKNADSISSASLSALRIPRLAFSENRFHIALMPPSRSTTCAFRGVITVFQLLAGSSCHHACSRREVATASAIPWNLTPHNVTFLSLIRENQRSVEQLVGGNLCLSWGVVRRRVGRSGTLGLSPRRNNKATPCSLRPVLT
jgi:hypothetical protein